MIHTGVPSLQLLSGGQPRFATPLHVGRPNLGDRARLHARLDALLERAWLTNDGPFNQEFERRVAELAGVKHCVAMCNATIALEIAIRALGLSGEVILPAYTFVATAHALQWQGLTPVFCDIDPVTQNLDPGRVEELISPRTTGIIGVHLWGRSCAVEALQEIARRRGLALLFDAAHALGCTHRGQMIGGFGQAEVFSFHATKFVQSGEGGAVVTNNDELAAKMRLMRNFGFSGYDNVIYLGTNGKMNELSAAMGLTSLESMSEFVALNRAHHESYAQALRQLPGISLLNYNEQEANNFQYVVLEINEQHCPLTRDQLLRVLQAENVLARRYFFPGVHRMEPYRTLYPQASARLPVTEQVAHRVLVLPSGSSITARDIFQIGDIFRLALQAAPQLRTRLPENFSAAPPELAGSA